VAGDIGVAGEVGACFEKLLIEVVQEVLGVADVVRKIVVWGGVEGHRGLGVRGDEFGELQLVAPLLVGADAQAAAACQIEAIGIEVTAGDAAGPVAEGFDIVSFLEEGDVVLAVWADAIERQAVHVVLIANDEVGAGTVEGTVEVEGRQAAVDEVQQQKAP